MACDPQINFDDPASLAILEPITGGTSSLVAPIYVSDTNPAPEYIDIYWQEGKYLPCCSTISYGSCNCIGQSIGIYRSRKLHSDDPVNIPIGRARLENITLAIPPYGDDLTPNTTLLSSWNLKRDQAIVIGDPALHIFETRLVSAILALFNNDVDMVATPMALELPPYVEDSYPEGARVVVWNSGAPTLWVKGPNVNGKLVWAAAAPVFPQASTTSSGITMLTTTANGRIAYGKGDVDLANMVILADMQRENVPLNPLAAGAQLIWEYPIPSTVIHSYDLLVTTSFEGNFSIGASSWVDFKHRMGTSEQPRRVGEGSNGFTSFTSKFSQTAGGKLECIAEFSGSNFSGFSLKNVSTSITIKQRLI
jgi:hypothetical protein